MPQKEEGAASSGENTGSYLRRAFTLLRFLADRTDAGARVPEICDKLQMHRVSAHRLIRSLVDLGYIEQSEDLSYHIGFEAWSLGLAASKRLIPSAVAKAMKRVSEASEESVFLMRKAGSEGICIASQEGSYPVRSVVLRVGVRRILGAGGTSIAILSALDVDEAERIIVANEKEYAQFHISADYVRKSVAEARSQGFSYSAGIMVPESRTIAVPLPPTRTDFAVLSMSIATLESRVQEPRKSDLAKLILDELKTL